MKIWDKIFKSKVQETRDFLPHSYTTYSPLSFCAEDDPTVSACISTIVNTLSVLPIKLYSHVKGGKNLAVSHWLFSILENPSVEETKTIYFQTLIKQLLYTGNAYIYLCRDSKGNIVTTKLVDSRRCRVDRTSDYHKIFIVDGKTYTERDILHIPYWENYNGTVGVSPIDSHKDLINLHQLLLEYINNYFKNSMGERVSLEFGESWGVKPQDIERMYSTVVPFIQKFVQGSANAGKPMINLPDSKLTTISQKSNTEAELHSLLELVEKEICNCFNVPYELIDSSQSKYNSLEQKNLDFLQKCILPLGNHIAESFEKLLLPTEGNLFVEWSYSNLLKTDFATTIDYISKEISSGLMTINEGRQRIGLSAVPENIGDVLFIPTNYLPLTEDNINAILAQSKVSLSELNEDIDSHNPLGDDKN